MSPNTDIATTTPVANPVANQTQEPIRSVTSSIERSDDCRFGSGSVLPQRRSTLTFRTTLITEGIPNKTPNTGSVYRTLLRTPTCGSNFEDTIPTEMRLPLPMQSVQEQPEPEEAPTPRHRTSFALPPPALPAPQVTVSASHSPRVGHFLINAIGGPRYTT
jgi:hypothetical protein